MTVIDAKNSIVGRLASIAVKRALLGEKIDIVNCEQAVITGDKTSNYQRYKTKTERGYALKGPYYPKMPDRFVRRVVRGMLPYHQEKGNKAYKNIMCYIGIPDNLKHEKLEAIDNVDISKSKTFKYISIGELCKLLKR